MPDRLSLHAPVLVNTLGHCAGVAAFGILLCLLFKDRRGNLRARGLLPCAAALLALLWNVGSLIGLATREENGFADAVVAISFALLSLLPAVLLHISLDSRRFLLIVSGYVAGLLAAAFHIADLVTGAPRFHVAALLLVVVAFGLLAFLTLWLEFTGKERTGSGRRVLGAMLLFALALSFAHFRSGHPNAKWLGEAILHHAGLPLALFVILQDYRFLLLDVFIRFVANAILAAAAVFIAFLSYPLFPRSDPFWLGLLLAASCLLISLFAVVRGWVQQFLTRVVFLRGQTDPSLAQVRAAAGAAQTEIECLDAVVDVTGGIFSAKAAVCSGQALATGNAIDRAAQVFDSAKSGLPEWTKAAVSLRFSRGDAILLCLGARAGARRYLSEDIELLTRIAAITCERVERLRNSEIEALLTKAELRALQAQINPHFFFNAMNTLYGTIPREVTAARKLVLNLSNLFRVSFASERAVLKIDEEIRIVRAYLEIEQLRLGSRLRAEIDVDERALPIELPALSIQPLVENAVKHGVAARPGDGFIRLRIRVQEDAARVEITNSGAFGSSSQRSDGAGVGLENVRRRLSLHYGDAGSLSIESDDAVTRVHFTVPILNQN